MNIVPTKNNDPFIFASGEDHPEKLFPSDSVKTDVVKARKYAVVGSPTYYLASSAALIAISIFVVQNYILKNENQFDDLKIIAPLFIIMCAFSVAFSRYLESETRYVELLKKDLPNNKILLIDMKATIENAKAKKTSNKILKWTELLGNLEQINKELKKKKADLYIGLAVLKLSDGIFFKEPLLEFFKKIKDRNGNTVGIPINYDSFIKILYTKGIDSPQISKQVLDLFDPLNKAYTHVLKYIADLETKTETTTSTSDDPIPETFEMAVVSERKSLPYPEQNSRIGEKTKTRGVSGTENNTTVEEEKETNTETYQKVIFHDNSLESTLQALGDYYTDFLKKINGTDLSLEEGGKPVGSNVFEYKRKMMHGQKRIYYTLETNKKAQTQAVVVGYGDNKSQQYKHIGDAQAIVNLRKKSKKD